MTASRGKYGYTVGDIVSTESHIVCGVCHQCRMGDSHVCARDKIIGISQDGCFASTSSFPAKALWPTNVDSSGQRSVPCRSPLGTRCTPGP